MRPIIIQSEVVTMYSKRWEATEEHVDCDVSAGTRNNKNTTPEIHGRSNSFTSKTAKVNLLREVQRMGTKFLEN